MLTKVQEATILSCTHTRTHARTHTQTHTHTHTHTHTRRHTIHQYISMPQITLYKGVYLMALTTNSLSITSWWCNLGYCTVHCTVTLPRSTVLTVLQVLLIAPPWGHPPTLCVCVCVCVCARSSTEIDCNVQCAIGTTSSETIVLMCLNEMTTGMCEITTQHTYLPTYAQYITPFTTDILIVSQEAADLTHSLFTMPNGHLVYTCALSHPIQ